MLRDTQDGTDTKTTTSGKLGSLTLEETQVGAKDSEEGENPGARHPRQQHLL